jgi:methylglutaconyl-CoA hydratase
MLRVDRQDAVVTLTLERPEAGNALDGELILSLEEALASCMSDSGVRVIVLTGAGRIFSAGADLAYMRSMRDAGLETNLADALRTQRLFASLQRMPRPVVARVNGPARGGGVGFLAAADVAVAVEGTSFAFPEVHLGIIPAMIAPFVIARIGPARARRLFLTGESFGVAEALAWGLVDQVVPADQLDAAVAAVVADLLRGGPLALAEVKALFHDIPETPPAEVGALTAERIAELRQSEEGQEGMAASLEKRPPRWVK